MKITYLMLWFKERGMQLLRLEKNYTKLVLSSCLGVYIAFSPFVGLHTAMVFFFSWLFNLNLVILFTVSMMINNPWTMVPVYGLGYWFGDFLLSWFGINHHAFNPGWIVVCNNWLHHYIAWEGFSFWAFILGGNVLGIILAGFSYLLITWFVKTIGVKSKQRMLHTMIQSKKAVRSLKEKAVPVIRRVAQKSRLQRTAYETNNSK